MKIYCLQINKTHNEGYLLIAYKIGSKGFRVLTANESNQYTRATILWSLDKSREKMAGTCNLDVINTISGRNPPTFLHIPLYISIMIKVCLNVF